MMAAVFEEAPPAGSGSSALTWVDAAFFAAVFVFVYAQLFQFPGTPYYFEGDQFIPPSNALRMLGGEVIYRDFFHLTPPGADLFYETLFSIFGVRIWVLNFAILLLSLAQVFLLWYFSQRLLRGTLVFLPAAIYSVIGYRAFGIDGSYRLYSVVFALFAIAVIFDKRTARRLIAAGVLCGVSSFFVQTRGVVGLAAIGVFIVWESYIDGFNMRKVAVSGLYLAVGFFAVSVLLHSYFAWQAGVENYYFCLVTFLRENYSSDPLSNSSAYFGSIPSLQGFLDNYPAAIAVSRFIRVAAPSIFYYALIPPVYFFALFVVWRRGNSTIDRRIVLLCFAGLLLAGGVSAASAGRFYQVAIPGTVVLVWLLAGIGRSVSRGLQAVLVLLACVAAAYVIQRQTVTKSYLEMPSGRAAFLSEDTFEKYRWIGDHTSDGEVFYEAFHPSFYVPFHLKNPTPLYLVRDSNYTPAFQINAAVEALQRTKPELIVWDGRWSKPDAVRRADDHLGPMWNFISANYEMVKDFQETGDFTLNSDRDIEIWRLKSPN